jgi:hypothetical protein
MMSGYPYTYYRYAFPQDQMVYLPPYLPEANLTYFSDPAAVQFIPIPMPQPQPQPQIVMASIVESAPAPSIANTSSPSACSSRSSVSSSSLQDGSQAYSGVGAMWANTIEVADSSAPIPAIVLDGESITNLLSLSMH